MKDGAVQSDPKIGIQIQQLRMMKVYMNLVTICSRQVHTIRGSGEVEENKEGEGGLIHHDHKQRMKAQ
jgi:hypothetical protein